VHGSLSGAGGFATSQASPEPDEVPSIVELLVIDGLVANAIGGALNQKDRTSSLDSQRRCDIVSCGDSLELIFRLDERDVVRK